MKFSLFLLFLIGLFFIKNVDGGKIGIFVSTFSNSQLVFGYRLAEVLSKQHEVVMIRPEYNPKTRAFKNPVSSVREIHLQVFNSSMDFDKFSDFEHRLLFEEPSINLYWEANNKFQDLFLSGCKIILNDAKFLKEIEDEKFDLVFTHHYDLCPFAVMHHAKVPKWMYTISSPIIEQVSRIFGIPSPPSFVPALFSNTTNQLSFRERAANALYASLSTFATKFYFNNYDSIVHKQFGPNFPLIRDLVRKSKLIFVNDFEFLEYPRPISSVIINIGSIGINISKPVEENEFKSFVSASTKPIVIVSLGTVANEKNFPSKWKNEFIKFFELNKNINFIWKFDDSNLNLPENVLMKKWIPQTSLLANEKIVAFIGHCGFNGLQEAILTATPIICIPLSLDQPRNAKLVENKNIGTYLPKSMFSAEALTQKLKETLENETYLKSIQSLRSLILDRPFNSSELLIRWTEFTIKHDFDFTFPDVGIIEYYNLDIFVPCGIISFFITFLILRSISRLYYWSCCTMAYRDKQKLQ